MKKNYFFAVYKKGKKSVIDNTNFVCRGSFLPLTKEQYNKVKTTILEIFPECEITHDEFDID